MSRGVNKTVMIGNLGADPVKSETPNGKVVTEFSLAINEYNGTTTWLDFACFGKTAEFVAEYLRKGSTVFVEGRVEHQTWEKDGRKNHKYKIIASNVQALSSGKAPTTEAADIGI